MDGVGLQVLERVGSSELWNRESEARHPGRYRRRLLPIFRVRCPLCGDVYRRTGWRSNAVKVRSCNPCARTPR